MSKIFADGTVFNCRWFSFNHTNLVILHANSFCLGVLPFEKHEKKVDILTVSTLRCLVYGCSCKPGSSHDLAMIEPENEEEIRDKSYED